MMVGGIVFLCVEKNLEKKKPWVAGWVAGWVRRQWAGVMDVQVSVGEERRKGANVATIWFSIK